ncbi:winged helix-turn-helix domain-containing protein [Vibrio navarrensis]|uniref:Winged helix-turn-helix domain-containing protein n=1 Tax=Vibrio navarrensis TaxID=29495 RepID=A0AAJ4LWE2_9VIBR|nr:winged helix-turn-helix domain-containing protein [Vibrio navarrensis]QPL55599.1 winged helix-turn-helix domain-containing protein [Vibrio navarrensis]
MASIRSHFYLYWYYLLDHMGLSWITSRSKHPKQSQEVQDDFKKNSKLKRS